MTPKAMARRLLSIAALSGAGVTAHAQATEPPPRPFLRKVIQLDDAKLAAIDAGEIVTTLLPSPDKAEIAAFGGVLMGKVRDGIETGMKENLKFARARLAEAR